MTDILLSNFADGHRYGFWRLLCQRQILQNMFLNVRMQISTQPTEPVPEEGVPDMFPLNQRRITKMLCYTGKCTDNNTRKINSKEHES